MTGRRRIDVHHHLLPPRYTPRSTPRARANSRRWAGSRPTSAHALRSRICAVGYARWFAPHGAAVALVRPDFAVFGTAPALDGAAALVAALRERL